MTYCFGFYPTLALYNYIQDIFTLLTVYFINTMAAIPPKTNIYTESKNEIAVDKYATELPYARHIIMITMD